MFCHSVQLPTELWLCILKHAVSSAEWRDNVFFPPPNDSTLLDGFKNASATLAKLVGDLQEYLDDKSISVLDAGKIVREKQPLQRVRHLMIQRNVAMADYLQLMPQCSELESLALSFSEREFQFLGLQSHLRSESLIRLDLSYPNVFWRPMSLDFPNLQELRLSAEKPWVRHDTATFAPAIYTTDAQRFGMDLIHTVHKLRSVTRLSLHISLEHEKSLDFVLEGHMDRHPNPALHFSQCPECCADYDNTWVIGQESRYSTLLAEALPKLERIYWQDAWRATFFDEESQRESRVSRKDDGGVEVMIGGNVIPPGAQLLIA